ncbi:alpha/beta fold hydrolase [Streptomyces sp. NPDC059477]|uniref:alpha/beta fold hydrolase n=1 Tax=Streptomyces sp. NPDC059477 TaxID=3346847 RepID=UPI0036A1EF3C
MDTVGFRATAGTNPRTARETGTLAVPGAHLYYEVRGSGPLLLLLCGGNSDAAVFDGLADHFAADHRVLTLDPRGNSRSPLDGPPVDQSIDVHADDAHRLLDRVADPDEPVRIFGSCSGGLIALRLAIRLAVPRPQRLAALVVHEPPAYALLSDAAQQLAFIDAVHATYRSQGIEAAMDRFSAAFGGRPAPVLPEENDNTDFFLAHVLRPFSNCVPDLAGLAPLTGRIVVAGGQDSRTHDVHRPAVALAERLGKELVLFPGGHVGYVKHPDDFGALLRTTFEGESDTGGGETVSGSSPCAPAVGFADVRDLQA